MDLRTLQDWTVRLILRTAPGVDDVTSWGGQEKQFQVRIDPMKLIAHKLGFKDVIEALQANNAQVGGNFVDVGREQYLVRGLGLVQNAQDIGQHRAEDGRRHAGLRARCRHRHRGRCAAYRRGHRDGKEVVLGMALARIGENAKSVVDAVKAKLDTVKQALADRE